MTPLRHAAAFGYALALAQGRGEEAGRRRWKRRWRRFSARWPGWPKGAAYALLMVAPAALTAVGELVVKSMAGAIVLEADSLAAEADAGADAALSS